MASAADLVTNSVADLSASNGNPKNEEKKMNFKEKIAYLREMITIEPLLCLYILASIVCFPVIKNLRLEMACFVNKNYSQTICEAILQPRMDDTIKTESSEVNQIITDMESWTNPVQSFIPVIYLIFLGTFSDRHKIRKPFLIIPIIGEFFACICCILCVVFKKSWPVEVEGVAQVIVPSLLGGPEMVSMAAFAYISDISTPEKRIARMAMLQVCFSIQTPIALLLIAVISDYLGYIGSFVLAFILFLLALIYGVIKVKEPRASGEEINTKSLIADIFNPQHAVGTCKFLIKTKGEQRKNIIFLLVIYWIITFILAGENSIFSGFVNHKFGWAGTAETYYTAAASIINLIALGIGIPILSRIFGFHDLIIIAIALGDKIIANIIIMAVTTACGMYMSIVAGILVVTATVGLNSQTTKYVSEDDMGKVQSWLLIVGFVARLVSSQVYPKAIWSNIDNWFPQGFFLVGVIVFIPVILALIWKYFKERNNVSFEVPVGENGTEMHRTETVT